jgi:ribose transport system permease protein
MSQTNPQTAPEPASTWSKLFAIREAVTLAALVLMLLVIAVAIPQFRQWENAVNITRNFSFVGIVAMGMTLVILTGGIDLSVGSVWGVSAT